MRPLDHLALFQAVPDQVNRLCPADSRQGFHGWYFTNSARVVKRKVGTRARFYLPRRRSLTVSYNTQANANASGVAMYRKSRSQGGRPFVTAANVWPSSAEKPIQSRSRPRPPALAAFCKSLRRVGCVLTLPTSHA